MSNAPTCTISQECARRGKHAFRLNVTKQEDGRYKYVLAGETEDDALDWLKHLVKHGVNADARNNVTRRKGCSGGWCQYWQLSACMVGVRWDWCWMQIVGPYPNPEVTR